MPDPSLSRGARAPEEQQGELRDDLSRAGSTQAPPLLDAALRLVTALASYTVHQADGVSVTLERRGRMTTVAASDHTIRRMDDHQYATGEGPCLAAAAEGQPFHSEFLAEEDRWPVFVPLAIDEGILSILSNPLFVSSRPVGALNIYSRTSWAFGPVERQVAALFADHAADILSEAITFDEQQGVRITEALTAREIIAMAQGVHMARLGISAEAAAAELHRTARAREVTVRAEAVAVLDSTRAPGAAAEDHHG